MNRLRILTLAYPLTPLGPEACGGTEQVAWLLLRELARRQRERSGFALTCVAAPGSTAPPGVTLYSWASLFAAAGFVWPQSVAFSPAALADLQQNCDRALSAWLARHRGAFDLIHNQGAYFDHAAAGAGVPVLFTLHLARQLYSPELFNAPGNVRWQCVSTTQARTYGAGYPVVANGVELASFPPRRRSAARNAPLLYLGRICPEKAAHAAIAIAHLAGRRLLLVGEPGPFPAHRRYFERTIAPHLGPGVRRMTPPTAAHKRALIRQAAAVVIPSRIAETSSLVAMEAAACGVPVLALRRGALVELVAEGKTGWLGENDAELAAAAAHLDAIAPEDCRHHASRHFCGRRMGVEYAALYARLAA